MGTTPARSEPASSALARMDTLQALDHLTETPLALGAAGLRHSYKQFLLTALVVAVALHVAGFGSFRLVSLWGDEVIVEDEPLVGGWYEPPVVPPEEPLDSPASSPVAAAPATSGTPAAVPDAEADSATAIAPPAHRPSTNGADVGRDVGVVPGMGPVGRFTSPQPPPLPPPPAPSAPEDSDEPPPRFHPVEEMAVAVSQPPPEYPDFARRAGVEGRVIVEAWVTAEGTVREVRLLQGAHPLLDEAAVEAVRRWTFSPAKQNNRAVAVWVSVPIYFRLN